MNSNDNLHKDNSSARKMDKQALWAYTYFSAAVYGSALIYCYKTDHLLEVGLLSVIVVGVGIYLASTFKKI